MKTKVLLLVIVPVTILFISGCKRDSEQTLQKELLFSIPIGKMEDELSFFQLEENPFREKIRLFMRDGLFYISNGGAHKIMQFNSYGDILSLYFNERENPQPVLLSMKGEEGTVSNREAYPYPFNEVGEIAVTDKRELLVQETVPKGRGEFDNERTTMLDQIVLRFDKSGELIDFLGQEGVGGTPFPFIERLHVSSRDDIIVVSRTMKSWIVFWYNWEGRHMYTVEISYDNLPLPADEEEAIPHLDTIYPDLDAYKLYVKLDYYINEKARTTTTTSGIEYYNSQIHTFDIRTEQYTEPITLPHHMIDQDDFDVLEIEQDELLYEFLGIASDGYFFFLSRDEGSYYQLLILDKSGGVVERARIILKDTEMLYRTFYLAPEGILSALLCEQDKAEVVWWRSDTFLERERELLEETEG
jgi:hypothetical protein